MFYVYKIICAVNGKSYVGITNDPDRRYKEHMKFDGGAVALTSAIKKYGPESFKHTILAVFDDALSALTAEQESIIRHNTVSPDGYNLAVGAPFTCYAGLFSDNTRKRMEESKKRFRNNYPLLCLSFRLGKKHTEETKKKISEFFTGKKRPEWVCQKLRGVPRPHIGHPQSEEAKRKISEGMKKHIRTKEHRQHIADSKRGISCPEYVKAKISQTLKGRLIR